MLKIPLEAHNRHLRMLGLPPVERPLADGDPLAPMPPEPQGSIMGIFNKQYAGEGPTSPRNRFIHWWGQFSHELPSPFTLDKGGHGYIETRDVDQATELFAVLRDAVLKMTPQIDPDNKEAQALGLDATREWAGISDKSVVWYRWMRTDGKQMTVLFPNNLGSPHKSEYKDLR